MNQVNRMTSPSPVQQVKIFYRVEMLINGQWHSHEIELAQPPQFGPGGPTGTVVNIRPPAPAAAPTSRHSLPKPREQAPAVAADPGAYVIRFGKKYKGVRLDRCGVHEISDYAYWLRAKAIADGKALRGLALETVDAIEAFVKTREFVRKPGLPRPR